MLEDTIFLNDSFSTIYLEDLNIDTLLLEDTNLINTQFKDKFQKLKENNIDTDKFVDITRKTAVKMGHELTASSDGKITSKSREHLADICCEGMREIWDSFSLKDSDKYAKSVVLLVMVIFIQLLSFILLALLIPNPLTISLINSIITAPITEEISKYISIEENMEKEYFIVFNVVEFSNYVLNITKAGGKLTKALILRLASSFMHFTTTFIQKRAKKENEKEISKQDNIKAALILSIVIHGFWNFLANVFDSPLSNWVAK